MQLNNLKVLSKNDIKMIHDASLDILENIGVKIDNKAILEFLDETGILVDYHTKIAKYPKRMLIN